MTIARPLPSRLFQVNTHDKRIVVTTDFFARQRSTIAIPKQTVRVKSESEFGFVEAGIRIA